LELESKVLLVLSHLDALLVDEEIEPIVARTGSIADRVTGERDGEDIRMPVFDQRKKSQADLALDVS